MIWEQRWHPLRREWVIVSSHRNERPWLGERVAEPARALAPTAYVPDCYLCPGNARSSGQRNDRYSGVFVFDNDHPCVGPGAPRDLPEPAGIYRNEPASGCARVVCFTPRHDLTLAQLVEAEVRSLLGVLQAQYRELGARDDVRHAAEEADGRRWLVRRDQAVSFVPYFARYPYETFVAPLATRPSLADLAPSELADLAAVLRETLIRLDNLWRMSFPYVMVLHQAPTDGAPHPGFHFHIQIHPPLRKPGLLKYLAGPEIGGGNFLNDTAPEEKAAELRAVSSVHYTQGD